MSLFFRTFSIVFLEPELSINLKKPFLKPVFAFVPISQLYLGFLSGTFTIYRTTGERGGCFIKSSLPHPLASQKLRHWLSNYQKVPISQLISTYGFSQVSWLNIMSLRTFFKTNLWFNYCVKTFMLITYSILSCKLALRFSTFLYFFSFQVKMIYHC